jgi:excisionase family DNA binding protein
MTDDDERARSVLDKLYAMAMRGNVIAADVFLDHIRGDKTREPAAAKPPASLPSGTSATPKEKRARTMMSVSEAAEELGLSGRTVFELARKGQLAVCRVGRRVLVRSGELQRFIAEHSS